MRDWECLYVHSQSKLFLSIYVDDFKMAGNASALPKMWARLQKKIDLEPPVKMDGNVYLGCGQDEISPDPTMIAEKRKMFSDLLTPTIKIELTPEEEAESNLVEDKYEIKNKPSKSPVRAYQHAMAGHAQSCIDRYCELAKITEKSIKPAATPCIDDHQLSPDDFVNKGCLSDVAARIVLKVLYLARVGRLDLLWSVNCLAREVTKWTVACDKRLLRLIQYIKGTMDYTQMSFV